VNHALSGFSEIGCTHSHKGLQKPLLGAPLGSSEFIEEAVEQQVKGLLEPIKELHRIQDAQLEGVMLRCYFCTKSMFLLRLLRPQELESALTWHESVIRAELSRILGTTVTDSAFEQHKQPSRGVGCGGHARPALVASAAHSAAHGAVARMATRLQHVPALASIPAKQTKDTHLQTVAHALATMVNTDDDKPSCPSSAAITAMPSQKQLSNVLHTQKQSRQIAGATTPIHKAWLRSCASLNAGAWTKSVSWSAIGFCNCCHQAL